MSIEILQAKARDGGGVGPTRAAIECIADGAEELRGIVWVDQGADHALRQRIDAAIAVAADNRQARSRSFEKYDAKAFLCARHDENVSETKVFGKLRVGDMPSKPHCMRDAPGLRQFLEALPVIPVAHDEIDNLRDAL